MGYYVRVFCTSDKLPELSELQGWLHEHEIDAFLADPDLAVEAAEGGPAVEPLRDLIRDDWDQVALVYKAGKLPILLEASRDDGSKDCLLREEVEEFLEMVGDAPPTAERQRVIDHLRATRLLVACQLPISDIDDDGYEANSALLDCFVERHGGMIQADGEGFYLDGEVAVELDGDEE